MRTAPLLTLLLATLLPALPRASAAGTPQDADGAQAPAPQVGRGGRYTLRFHTGEKRIEALLIGASSQAAIEAGIGWILKRQDASGAWRPDFEGEAPPEPGDESVAPTALALLALLGDGRVPGSTVERGGRWLVGRMDAASGLIGADIHDHVLATVALAELWNLSAQAEWRAPLELALAHLISWQRRGAWAMKKGDEGDPMLTAWATTALSTARDGGLEVPVKTTQKTVKWVTDNTMKSGAVKRPRGAAGARERGVAAVLCTRQELGELESTPAPVLEAQVGRLEKNSALPEWPAEGAADKVETDLQYWFWATHGLHAVGGRRWANWHAGLVDVLLARQAEDGSWSPARASEDCPGRVGATAFAVLGLEAPYRYRTLGGVVVKAAGPGGEKPTGKGSLFGDRFGKRRGVRALGGAGTEEHVQAGLDWLARHQTPDGFWDADGFMKRPGGDCTCDGPGDPLHDVGVTSLALLAFLGDGNTPDTGPYRDLVAKGVTWLVQRQDARTGVLGGRRGHSWMYDHTIATLVLAEASLFTGDPDLRERTQLAIDFIVSAREPDAGWRYDAPGQDSDTSVTGWAYLALHAAQDAGYKVDPTALDGALKWFDAVTQPGTFRTGYDAKGSVSARISGINDQFPPIKGEPMTAIAMLCRRLAGEASDNNLLVQQAELLLKQLPQWTPDDLNVDMYFWYYGSYAMFQVGGSHWKAWNKALKEAAMKGQHERGEQAGSWDPVGPWGFAGGRVYSTSLMVLALEVYYRYGFVE